MVKTKAQRKNEPTPSSEIRYEGIYGGNVQSVRLAQFVAIQREIDEARDLSKKRR